MSTWRASSRRMPSGQGPARGGSRPPGLRVGPRAPMRSPHQVPAPRVGSTAPPQRAAARSGGIRRAAGPARRMRPPRRPPRLSGRAVALGLLLIALALAYAYPVRVFLAQQSQIEQLRSAQEEQRQRIQQLSGELARWDDDDYVAAQARSRLHWVRPGERLYVVEADQDAVRPGGPDPDQPWYTQLWSNVQAADAPADP